MIDLGIFAQKSEQYNDMKLSFFFSDYIPMSVVELGAQQKQSVVTLQLSTWKLISCQCMS